MAKVEVSRVESRSLVYSYPSPLPAGEGAYGFGGGGGAGVGIGGLVPPGIGAGWKLFGSGSAIGLGFIAGTSSRVPGNGCRS